MSKKRTRSLGFRTIAGNLLYELGDAAEILAAFATYRGAWKLRYYGYDLEEMREDMAYEQKLAALRKLKQQKYLMYRKLEHGFEIAFTAKGMQEYFRQGVWKAGLLPDQELCVVVFDIPERCRALRKRLRKFLRASGFVPIQQSVWLSFFDAAAPLRNLFDSAGLDRKWLRIFTAEESVPLRSGRTLTGRKQKRR